MAASAVLFSGGLDSAVLLAYELTTASAVQPIQVRAGLAWEDAESTAIARLLARPPFASRALPLRSLSLDMRDVYAPTHWALTGQPPAYDTPDEDVYLLGRNISLIAKAAVLAARLGLPRLVLGPLAGNPFPDARPEFFTAMAAAMTLGLDHPIEIAAPFRTWHKEDVIALGVTLGVPLEDTLSCMNPVMAASGSVHCNACSKCRERRDAFAAAGVADPTAYAASPAR